MSKIPNLYLKWKAFRSLIHDDRKDNAFALLVCPDLGKMYVKELHSDKKNENKKHNRDRDQSSVVFSRVLYGDMSCHQTFAMRLLDQVMNPCIAHYRKTHGLPGEPDTAKLSLEDITELSSNEFTRRLIAAAGKVSTTQLDAIEKAFLAELTPTVDAEKKPQLAIRRYDTARSFAGWEKSKSKKKLEFEPGRHFGEMIVEDLAEDPVATYAFMARNPYPQSGKRVWELDWQDTVLWLPSPRQIARTGNTLTLMPLSPVEPDLGTFKVTAVLVFDQKALDMLDPRGAKLPGTLDELDTARFITNMKRLETPRKKTISWSKDPPIRVVANEYIVAASSQN